MSFEIKIESFSIKSDNSILDIDVYNESGYIQLRTKESDKDICLSLDDWKELDKQVRLVLYDKTSS